jgi:hypothetical protein
LRETALGTLLSMVYDKFDEFPVHPWLEAKFENIWPELDDGAQQIRNFLIFIAVSF